VNPVSGRLIKIQENEAGLTGTIDVRGARMDALLLLTPGATIGDTLLIEAGVAVAILDRAPSSSNAPERNG